MKDVIEVFILVGFFFGFLSALLGAKPKEKSR
jgi:hypothetical protein